MPTWYAISFLKNTEKGLENVSVKRIININCHLYVCREDYVTISCHADAKSIRLIVAHSGHSDNT